MRPDLFRFALLLWGIAAVSGCQPGELQDLETYNQIAQKRLKPLLGAYGKAITEASSLSRREALQAAFSRRVLPALSAYVKALQAPAHQPKTPALRSLHQGLTQAYLSWQRALSAYHLGLKSDRGWVLQSLALEAQAQKLQQAERRYRTGLKSFIQRRQPR